MSSNSAGLEGWTRRFRTAARARSGGRTHHAAAALAGENNGNLPLYSLYYQEL